jgi:hypothetical protein
MADNAARAIVQDDPLECDGAQALEVQRVLELMNAVGLSSQPHRYMQL